MFQTVESTSPHPHPTPPPQKKFNELEIYANKHLCGNISLCHTCIRCGEGSDSAKMQYNFR